jgi:hypothetical protein
MKTYIDHKETVVFENNWIPKDPNNTDYARFLQELKEGKAELVPYVPPAPTWEQIRAQRDALLKDSDWSVAGDANPKPSKEAWLTYRQALRDIPTTFKTPEEVVWPKLPA